MATMANLKDVLSEAGGVTRSLSLAEDAAQTIREMILLEKLAPGTALPERDLAAADAGEGEATCVSPPPLFVSSPRHHHAARQATCTCGGL